jgi:pimeloyl-ACP methyl ester carboxylesterase
MGLSQPESPSLNVEQMADDARALMEAQGWDSAHVVGHSLGGLVAMHLALTARARVRSLSLLCTFARGRDVGKLSAWMVWVGLRTKFGTRAMRRRAFLRIVMPPASLRGIDRDMLARQVGELFGHDLADQPAVVKAQLRAMRGYDATPRLRELAGLPTLVVSAAHDRIAPPALGRAIAAGVPGSRYEEMAEASHGAPIQCPAPVNALLREHFALTDSQRRL